MLVRLACCVALAGCLITPHGARAADCAEEISKLMSKDTEKLTTRYQRVTKQIQEKGANPKLVQEECRIARQLKPRLEDQLAAMKEAGCNRILIAPLYPQYSGATTGTVHDDAYAALTAMRWHPAIRTLPAYHDDPAYIGALKISVEASLANLDFTPDALVATKSARQ